MFTPVRGSVHDYCRIYDIIKFSSRIFAIRSLNLNFNPKENLLALAFSFAHDPWEKRSKAKNYRAYFLNKSVSCIKLLNCNAFR